MEPSITDLVTAITAPTAASSTIPESFPLDLNSLRTLKASIQEESQRVNAKVYEKIVTRYREFTEAYRTSFDLRSKTESVLRQLDTLRSEIEHPENGITAKLLRALQEKHDVEENVRVNAICIALLEHYSKIHEWFQGIDSLLEESLFKRAATAIIDMNSLLLHYPLPTDGLKAVEQAKIRVLELNTSLFEECEVLYQQAVDLEHSKEETTITIRQKLPASTRNNFVVSLSEVVSALTILGKLESQLGPLKRHVIRHIVIPLLHFPQSTTSVSEKNGSAHLNFRSINAPKTPPNKDDLELIFNRLTETLFFLRDHLFQHADEAFSQFGEILYRELADAIVTEHISAIIPSEPHELEEFETVAQKIKSFEGSLRDVGFTKSNALETYVNEIDSHFVHRKRDNLLYNARLIMLGGDYDTVLVEDAPIKADPSTRIATEDVYDETGFGLDEELFIYPKCSISRKAKKIVELAHETMTEGLKLNSQCAMGMYRATRDLFDLFIAIVPVHQSTVLDTIPAQAMLFHNDCMYVAHHLTVMGYHYAPWMPKTVKESTPVTGIEHGEGDEQDSRKGQGEGEGEEDAVVTFVDMVPEYRRLAVECFNRQLRTQQSIMFESLDIADGFEDTIVHERFENAEKAVNQVVLTLINLSKVWKPILTQHLYFKSLGLLFNAVLDRVLTEIERLDISADESKELHLICTGLFKCDGLFRGDSAEGEEKTILHRYVPIRRKFTQFLDILQLSLAEIMDRYRSGELRPEDFGGEELSTLVRALFADTELRSRCLEEIGRLGRRNS